MRTNVRFWGAKRLFSRATPHLHLEKAYRIQKGKKIKKADLGEEHTTHHKPHKFFTGKLLRTALVTTIKNNGGRYWTKQ